jgi:hypothetical protein
MPTTRNNALVDEKSPHCSDIAAVGAPALFRRSSYDISVALDRYAAVGVILANAKRACSSLIDAAGSGEKSY